MLIFYLFFLLLCDVESQRHWSDGFWSWQWHYGMWIYDFWPWAWTTTTPPVQHYFPAKFRSTENANSTHRRLVEMMRSYYEEAHYRTRRLNPIRFMYEESPQYEMGYIMGEIIERYRKVLEHTQRPVRFLGMTLFDVIKRVEFVQKLYFELYHLVRMMHETPRKWAGVFEFKGIEDVASFNLILGEKPSYKTYGMTFAQLDTMKERMAGQQKAREEAKLRLRKHYEKWRKLYLETLVKPDMVKKKYLKWPIDYGWEIDYYW